MGAVARKPGRPRSIRGPNEASVVIGLKLPSRVFDQIFREAQRARITMPEVIRRRLRAKERLEDETKK